MESTLDTGSGKKQDEPLGMITTSASVRTCSSLDHIWKVSKWTDSIARGEKCLCGKRRWGIEPKKVEK